MNARALLTGRDDGSLRPTFWRFALAAILAMGLYATGIRFGRGLGAATSLSDQFPWGLWIAFDLLVGVGLAAGGFVVAATVHVFRLHKYEPIARPAVLTAFLGYLLVIVALLFDLGRPWAIWHPLIMWNPHSVMFEVGWCVTLYTTVLALEFSPLVFERLRWKKLLRLVRTVYLPLVIVGVMLSTLHQSSLGTLYVIVEGKLHPLWYTPLLPVFFFITAVAGGLAMTIFESYMSARAFGKHLEPDLLDGLARVIVVVLFVFTFWKTLDLYSRGHLGLVFQVTPESVMFWGEMGLGSLLPMVLFALPRVRRSEGGMFFAALMTVMGFIIGRLNVAITGMTAASGVHYFPSVTEISVSVMLVAVGFVAFGLAVRFLHVFPAGEPRVVFAAHAGPLLTRGRLLALWALLFAGVVLVAASTGRTSPAQVPAAAALLGPLPDQPLRLPGRYTFPVSPNSPGPVTFDHAAHVDSARPSCRPCHTVFSIRTPGAPQHGALTFTRVHEGELCASCHNGTDAFAVRADCTPCHTQGPEVRHASR